MKRFLSGLWATAFVCTLGGAEQVYGQDANAILDKAIKAVGGEEVLKKAEGFSWKSKGTINFGGNESEFTSQATAKGISHYRSEFSGEFGGNQVQAVTVIADDKGWRKFGDMVRELEGEQLDNEKRNIYLQLVPSILLPLKGKGFKVAVAGEEQVDGKPAVGLKVTPPVGNEYTLYFDKESGLPVKQVAQVSGPMNQEFTQETTFSDYKDFGGMKRATKVASKRDGEDFVKVEVTEFKVLDKVDPKTFSEPE